MSNVQQIIDQNTKPAQPGGDRRDWRPEWNIVGFLFCAPIGTDTNIYDVSAGDLPVNDRNQFDLTKYADYIAVRISKSSHRDFPGHRFALGCVTRNGMFVPDLSPRVADQRSGTPNLSHANGVWDTAASLLEAARKWHETDVAISLDRYVDASSGNSGPAPTRHKGIGGPASGKTERNRAKGKAKAVQS